MRYSDIKQHLRPYLITGRRTTTINHAFAAAIAPFDEYDEERVKKALRLLGQDPDSEILCAYCGSPAETWDHVHATVRKTKFSGHGHRVGNLLPCCKPCNSKKGSKDWQVFLKRLAITEPERNQREGRIAAYLKEFLVSDDIPEHLPEYAELQQLRLEVLKIFKRADELAKSIREKSRK
ncbi:MAG TPA: HNH endonuclease [Phycisphaerae bacterium]|nr:HNH endonuclease [Phycisphaerae bacterium]